MRHAPPSDPEPGPGPRRAEQGICWPGQARPSDPRFPFVARRYAAPVTSTAARHRRRWTVAPLGAGGSVASRWCAATAVVTRWRSRSPCAASTSRPRTGTASARFDRRPTPSSGASSAGRCTPTRFPTDHSSWGWGPHGRGTRRPRPTRRHDVRPSRATKWRSARRAAQRRFKARRAGRFRAGSDATGGSTRRRGRPRPRSS